MRQLHTAKHPVDGVPVFIHYYLCREPFSQSKELYFRPKMDGGRRYRTAMAGVQAFRCLPQASSSPSPLDADTPSRATDFAENGHAHSSRQGRAPEVDSPFKPSAHSTPHPSDFHHERTGSRNSNLDENRISSRRDHAEGIASRQAHHRSMQERPSVWRQHSANPQNTHPPYPVEHIRNDAPPSGSHAPHFSLPAQQHGRQQPPSSGTPRGASHPSSFRRSPYYRSPIHRPSHPGTAPYQSPLNRENIRASPVRGHTRNFVPRPNIRGRHTPVRYSPSHYSPRRYTPSRRTTRGRTPGRFNSHRPEPGAFLENEQYGTRFGKSPGNSRPTPQGSRVGDPVRGSSRGRTGFERSSEDMVPSRLFQGPTDFRTSVPRAEIQTQHQGTAQALGRISSSGSCNATAARANSGQNLTTSSSSLATSRGRKRAWWVVECFLETFNAQGHKIFACLYCKQHRSGKMNASRLAEHLWNCSKIEGKTRKRLYRDSAHIQSVVKQFSRDLNSDGDTDDELDSGRPRKRSRKSNVATSSTESISTNEANEVSLLFVRGVIEFCLPFTLFDSSKANPNIFRKAFRRLHPAYEALFPSRHIVVEKFVSNLYENARVAVQKNLDVMLEKGFGTIIFDGWDDITMSSVVNVLLRVETQSARKTFFLDSVYTGHQRMTAEQYVIIVEKVMEAFGGMKRIAGVASDSAKACVNAKSALSAKYSGLFGIQDQAHVADLLMKDIGKISFVKEVIEKVALIVSETRNKRKLLGFVRAEVKVTNASIRQEEQNRRQIATAAETENVIMDPLDPRVLFPPLRKTALMLRRPATTRFASVSDMFEAFIRTRDVLVKVISHSQFERNLFTADRPEQEERRDEYKTLIRDPDFLEEVKELYNVFRLCRRYLREFDKESVTASDVYGHTEFLEKALLKVPTSGGFLDEGKMGEIISRFKRRRDGPINGRGMQVRLINDIHIAACLFHPTKFLPNYDAYEDQLYEYVRRYVITAVIPDPDIEDEDAVNDSLDERRSVMINKIMTEYDKIHQQWKIADMERSRGNRPELARYERAYRASPLRFWNSELRDGGCEELCELALRTLSVSPSSCAAERSLSTQGRIRTKVRNRLSPDLVRKLMFIRWNIEHYDSSCRTSKQTCVESDLQMGKGCFGNSNDAEAEILDEETMDSSSESEEWQISY